MIKTIILIILSIVYFIAFPLNIGTITENTYGIFILIAFLIYLLCWIVPILYLGYRKRLSVKNMILIVLLNIIVTAIFFYFTETPYAIEIRQLREKKIREVIKTNTAVEIRK